MSTRQRILTAAVIAGAAFWSVQSSLADDYSAGQGGYWWGCPGMMRPDMMGQGMNPGMMGQGMMGRGMMGHGMGQGMMDHGMGPGMMNPGMMGQGMNPGMMGQGMGPDMMGQGTGMMGYWGPPQANLNLTANDVKGYLERWIAMMGNPHIKVGNVTENDMNTITADIVTTDKDALVQRFNVDRRTGFYSPA